MAATKRAIAATEDAKFRLNAMHYIGDRLCDAGEVVTVTDRRQVSQEMTPLNDAAKTLIGEISDKEPEPADQ